jgi:hypothetical protein
MATQPQQPGAVPANAFSRRSVIAALTMAPTLAASAATTAQQGTEAMNMHVSFFTRPAATRSLTATAKSSESVWDTQLAAFRGIDDQMDELFLVWDELEGVACDRIKQDVVPTMPKCMRGLGGLGYDTATLDQIHAAEMSEWNNMNLPPEKKAEKADRVVADVHAYRQRVAAVRVDANAAKVRADQSESVYEAALAALMQVPVANIRELAEKLEIAVNRANDDGLDACLADAQRLGSR